MTWFKKIGETTLADVTMKSVFTSTYTTNAAFLTVKYFLFLKIIVVKATNFAVVARKVDITLQTRF